MNPPAFFRAFLATCSVGLVACGGGATPPDSSPPEATQTAPLPYDEGTRYAAAVGGTGPTHAGVVAADFNGDGYPDAAVTDTVGNAVSVLLNNGDGSLGLPSRYLVGLLPYALISADLNRDGVADLAVANSRSDDLSVLLGNGDGSFASAVHYPSGLGPTDLAALDIDGDGDLDLLGYYGEISVHLNQGDGRFVAADDALVGEPSGAIAIAMELGDFNGDGRQDIAVTYWPGSGSDITQLLAGPDGSFTAVSPSFRMSGSTEAMRAADVNCDGATDLVVPVAGGELLILHGAAGIGLTEPQHYDADSGTNAVEFNDFDQDGRLDMAVSYFHGEIGIIRDVCRSDWTIPEPRIATVETTEAMTSPDFNLDGWPDLLVGTWFSPQIAIHLNKAGEP